MTIRAILRNGVIHPTEPLPPGWVEGQELVIENPDPIADNGEIEEWVRECEAAATQLPADDNERFLSALEEIEHESKEQVRREWGLS
ncbi:MAG TPA: hypothetical protein VLJ39_15810 [Tepidisphaeraceae bacterium]|nr:hypothetical protein [Tepidisphaeraceae bacterium]